MFGGAPAPAPAPAGGGGGGGGGGAAAAAAPPAAAKPSSGGAAAAAAPAAAAKPFRSELDGKKLHDAMVHLREQLAKQVVTFVHQARAVDEMDHKLLEERDRALRLQLTTKKLKDGAGKLASELELILHHQDAMDEALSALEKEVEEQGRAYPDHPSDRQQAYALFEHLDRELNNTRLLLDDTIERVNSRANRAPHPGLGAPTPSLNQLVNVLDVHLSAFQYLEQQGKEVEDALQQADRLLGQPRAP